MLIIKNSAGEIIKEINPDINKTLLKQIEDEWVEMLSACYTWICWACLCHVESWLENVNKSFRNEPWFSLWEDEVMTCIAWIKDPEKDIILRTMN